MGFRTCSPLRPAAAAVLAGGAARTASSMSGRWRVKKSLVVAVSVAASRCGQRRFMGTEGLSIRRGPSEVRTVVMVICDAAASLSRHKSVNGEACVYSRRCSHAPAHPTSPPTPHNGKKANAPGSSSHSQPSTRAPSRSTLPPRSPSTPTGRPLLLARP